eukprot:442876_1
MTVETVIYVTISVLIMIPLCISIYHSICGGQDMSRNAWMRVISIAGFSFAQIMFTMASLLDINPDIIFQCAGNTVWSVSEFMLILYFINRFYYAFLDSRYQVSNTTYKIFYIGATVYLIFQSMTTINIIILYFSDKNIHNYKRANIIEMTCDSISAIIDTGLNLYILHAFTEKILLLVCNTSLRKYSESSGHSAQYETRLLEQVTKYFVLLSLSILTSLVFLIAAVSSCISDLKLQDEEYFLYPETHYRLVDKVTNYIWQIDCICNTYCLFFERDYTAPYYNLICKKVLRIHPCSKSIFISRANKKKLHMQHQQPLMAINASSTPN